jgi:Glucodextranase, domain B
MKKTSLQPIDGEQSNRRMVSFGHTTKGDYMNNIRKASVQFFFALALVAAALVTSQLSGTEAQAQSSYYTSQGCDGCHSPAVATCNGCHAHGTHPSSAKSTINVAGTTNKATYAPGETVTVTITGGYRTGWFRAVLFDQNTVELARSTGNDSSMGSSAMYPATMSAPAPTTPGTYVWKAAWYGNQYDSGVYGTGWTPDATNPGHGYEIVSANSFTVASAIDTTAPVVGTFTLPATATSLTVPVSSFTATDNVAVTGYLITTSATAPAAFASGWTATAPASVTAVAGSNTFSAWAKDAAGNVSAVKSASVIVTIPPAADTTKPTLIISALANGSYTNKVTLNISGNASDMGGIKSVTVNDQAVTVNPDGSFSFALTLAAGANTITTIATDNAGNQQVDTRIVTYDLSATVLTVSAPADNSTTTQSFITVTGTVSEPSTVTISVNSGSPQSAAITGSTFSATVNLVPGVNTIDITATDLAGNTSSAKRTVTYDNSNTSLTLAVTYPSQDITTRSSSLTLKGTVADASRNVNVGITMDGKNYTPQIDNGAFQQRLTFTRAKLYAITVTATDAAGNSSTVSRNVIYRPTGDDNQNDDNHHDD